MLDYIYEDYLFYITPYSFFISIVVILTCVFYMAVYGNNKVVRGFLIFSIIAFLLAFIYADFEPRGVGVGPHYDCNRQLEQEAQSIASALADYFSIPTRTQVPKYSDLDFSGENSTILENMDSNRRAKLVKESEFSVKILGDASETLIVLSCKKGKCPFYRWKCPRPFRGKIYVKRMGDSGANGWLDSYEDI